MDQDTQENTVERAIVTMTLGGSLHVDRNATIRPDPPSVDPTIDLDIGDLPQLALPADGAPGELELGDVLGIGGMGVVQLALQRSLGRQVAVKRLKGGPDQLSDVQAILHEAWLNGALEHPNINPVYILGRDEYGLPVFAMRRIEGTPWTEFVRDPDRAAAASDVGDPLLFHLNTLIQVCNAVHYAHSKGIVHRDIKPDNVMIGAFGEVYLLDWGVAVSLRDETAIRGLPTLRTSKGVAGTPTHMAPEMVAGEAENISERTDVYLLGAALHNALTGKARHDAAALPAVIMKAYRSEPFEYPESVPAELASIANRATAKEPSDRFPSAEAFKLALALFLEHRSSAQLSQEAMTRVEDLEDLLDQGSDSPEDARQTAYQLLAQCRFGFQQALQAWPENRQATAGLQRALERMIRFELGRRSVQSASWMLAELPRPNDGLSLAVDALRDDLKKDHNDLVVLRQRERDLDVNLGTRARSVISTVLALLWGIPDIVIGGLELAHQVVPGYAFVTGRTMVYTASLAIATLIGRRALLGNAANRRIIASGFITFGAQFIIWPIGHKLGLPLSTSITMVIAAFTVIGGVMAVTIDRPIFLAAACLLACCFGSAWFPGFAYGWLGLAGLTSMGSVAVVWWPKGARPAKPAV